MRPENGFLHERCYVTKLRKIDEANGPHA